MMIRRRRNAAALLLTAMLAMAGCDHSTNRATSPQNPATSTDSASPSTAPDLITLPGNSYPSAMVLAHDGSLWVTEAQVSGIAKIDKAGHITQHRVLGTDNQPYDILQAPDGAIWYTAGDQIGHVTSYGKVVGWESGVGTVDPGNPDALTVGPDGTIWYATDMGQGATAVAHAVPSRGLSTIAVLPSTRFKFPPRGITTGPDHAVWFSELAAEDDDPDGIGRVTVQGTYKSWPLPSGTSPQDIVKGPDGALWFTQTTGLGRISVSGAVSHFPVPHAKHPTCVIAGPDGALWFTTDTRVGRLTAAGNLTLWPVPGAQALSSIVAIPKGGFWLADAGTSVIRRFSPPR
jgi:virginiamycin B lyase